MKKKISYDKSETKKIVELHAETAALCQSRIACAVADAWADVNQNRVVRVELRDALDRIEEVTRTSDLRKAKS